MAEKKTAAKPKVVFALQTCRIAHKDGSTMVYEGQSMKASDPVVKLRPELFSETAPVQNPHVRRAVERATAAPGEKRG